MGQYVGLLHPPCSSRTTTPPVVVPLPEKKSDFFLIPTVIVDRGDLGPSKIGEFFARLFFWDFFGLLHPPCIVRLLHPPVVVRLLHSPCSSPTFVVFFIFFSRKIDFSSDPFEWWNFFFLFFLVPWPAGRFPK